MLEEPQFAHLNLDFQVEMQNFLRMKAASEWTSDLSHRADIESDGIIRNLFGDVAMSWAAGEDGRKLATTNVVCLPQALHAAKISAEVQLFAHGIHERGFGYPQSQRRSSA